jgi:hypothetical protein
VNDIEPKRWNFSLFNKEFWADLGEFFVFSENFQSINQLIKDPFKILT